MPLQTPPVPPTDDKPEGPPKSDDQGDSGACVRFALAKAISNLLYKKKIDVDQTQIMITLVNIQKKICGISPLEYNDKVVLLQDAENARPGQKWQYVYLMKEDGTYETVGHKEQPKIPNRSWWEVKVHVKLIGRHHFVDNPEEYGEKKEYLLGYRVGTAKHCVYVRQRYKDVSTAMFDELVYECLNSWGFEEPTKRITMDDSTISEMFEVDITVNPLHYEKGMPHGGNCNGECLGSF